MNWRELRHAPELGARLTSLESLPDGGLSEVILGDGKEAFRILLARQGRQVKAYLNRCPHFGVPLNTEPNRFILLPQRQVMCAIHCAAFKLEDGQCVDGPVKGDHLLEINIDIVDSGDIYIAHQ